ncbi:nucleoside-triphosphatase [Treponema vincentii]|uniref:nucleoside-triphosphatase n=1 Tax=Treponema vincentii TaxID=69710 RepID=UPI0035F5AA74
MQRITTKRIFFISGERGCGKSTFLAALIQKFNLQPSGFITKREAPPECAVYMHQVVTGTARYRYTTGNKVGICPQQKPVGFAPIFDIFGVMCLKRAEEVILSSIGDEHSDADCDAASLSPALPVILMDELGFMEAEAEHFFRTVCALFSNPRYYIIGAVKPRGTRFLPVLEQMPEAAVFHLTLQNRDELYAQLERAQNFPAFLHTVGERQ